ncbi:unnamed protein product [Owenia fusiformis]|uniref:Uncharacterized protein n=1 Tax=Owenia fusiformis TaxID=6347 RepID=A0A8J1TB19_OWEFU|nr:unnamed protein product [Owenia fusiformis]
MSTKLLPVSNATDLREISLPNITIETTGSRTSTPLTEFPRSDTSLTTVTQLHSNLNTPNTLPYTRQNTMTTMDEDTVSMELTGCYSNSESDSDEVDDDVGIESDETDLDVSETIQAWRIPSLSKSRQEMKTDCLIGEKRYKFGCSHLNEVPQTTVLDQLANSELNLPHRYLNGKSLHPLTFALKENRNVAKLNLKNNRLGGDGAKHILNLLKANDFITELDISNNAIHLNRGAKAISAMMTDNIGLATLNLSGNDFDDHDAVFLASGIKFNKFISNLDLSHNDIGEIGAGYLAKALEENTGIQTLSLAWNKIRKSGAVSIAKSLKVNHTIENLDLSWNGVGYEGSLALSHTLGKNIILKSLNLESNRINWDCALMLSKALKQNTALEVLKIGDNPLTTTGCMDLIEAVGHADSAVKLLDLGKTPIILECHFIASAIQSDREFQCIHGAIVPSHDKLGFRKAAEMDPLKKMLYYVKDKELRLVELFRDFDKGVEMKVTNETFVTRLQNAGLKIPKWELHEMIEAVNKEDGRKSRQGDPITYKKLVQRVQEFTDEEREKEKIKRKKEERMRQYHTRILDLPKIEHIRRPSEVSSENSEEKNRPTLRGATMKLMSMNLGSIPKKKKKKRGKKKSKKAKSKK